MGEVHDLVLVSLVGIIDPLRPSAVEAVRIAHGAGIDVRMITGDHTVTARAIADQLGLGPGVITGADLQKLSDDEVKAQLPELHVFGRVAPEDKVRLARLMQESGEVVAMTGDAVNDAAALKQADVGVAMGSGSEVTKQAGKLILTDDNFGTLVHAVDLGRDIYRRISSYVKLQLTILSSVLQLMLIATILNINDGVALFPMQLLFAKFFVVATVVVGFIVDVPDPGVMDRPPRTPGSKIATGAQTVRWVISGFIIAGSALALLSWGPGRAEHHRPVDVDDDGVRRRRVERGQHGLRDASRTAGAVVGAAVPLHGVDHARLGIDHRRRRDRHAPAVCSTPCRSPAPSGCSSSACRWSPRSSSPSTRSSRSASSIGNSASIRSQESPPPHVPDEAPAAAGWRGLVPGITAIRTYERSWLRFDWSQGSCWPRSSSPRGWRTPTWPGSPR